jgi:hypothetical protein
MGVENEGPYTCSHCLNPTWNDDDVCDECTEDWAIYLEDLGMPGGFNE